MEAHRIPLAAMVVCLTGLSLGHGRAQAQTVIVTGGTVVPAQAAAPRAAAPAQSSAQALGAPNPGCVMVLSNGQQTQCPVVVIQANQPPPRTAPPTRAYAQPYRAYPAYANLSGRRHRVRYRPGMQLPPGGSIVERRHWGFAIPGLALFASHYLAVFWVGATVEGGISAANYVPVIGPLLTLSDAGYEGDRSIRIYDSLVQALGLALFIGGMHKTAYVEWRADDGVRRSFALAPGAGPRGASLTARLEF
ncbi:MAG: hypothetical protein GXP55_20765 [Deltaproteobacteria bacterium]|nr:hypothetical protein [Deltaproteobacteria bacterium]